MWNLVVLAAAGVASLAMAVSGIALIASWAKDRKRQHG